MKEKSFERRTELLEAALDEFISKNYDEASLNNIIKNAGISKGTFYYHFQDKQALYLFLLESSLNTKWEFINKRISDSIMDYSQKDIFDKFRLQASIAAEFGLNFPKYHRLSRMFAKEKGNAIYNSAKAKLGNDAGDILDEMIDDAINNGDFRNGIPRDFILKTITYMFTHFDEMFDTEEDFELPKMLNNLKNFVDFMKYGMGRVKRSDEKHEIKKI